MARCDGGVRWRGVMAGSRVVGAEADAGDGLARRLGAAGPVRSALSDSDTVMMISKHHCNVNIVIMSISW
jgi:hypothetical protein